MDAKNKGFLERVSSLTRDGRRPLSEFLQLSGQAGEDDLKAVRNFLFELYCQIYEIHSRSAEGSGIRFKFLQELSRGQSIEEITNLFIGNLYLTEYRLRARTALPAPDGRPRGLAERARHYIEQNHARRVALNTIAQDLAVSKEHLSRIFKKKYGMTVTEYLHQVRIDMARRLMADGAHSLKQICYETGYQSYNDFYRNFRKVTGQSPKGFMGPAESLAAAVRGASDEKDSTG